MKHLCSCPRNFGHLQILFVQSVHDEDTIQSLQIVKENMKFLNNTFFCFLFFNPLQECLNKQIHRIGSPMIKNGLVLSTCITDQNWDECIIAVEDTFNICKHLRKSSLIHLFALVCFVLGAFGRPPTLK